MDALWNDEQENPLQHLRVLDLTVLLPGPFFTRILAQYGAEVVKVEGLPGGDPMRASHQTGLMDWIGQGKRSVAVALKTAQGGDLVRRLAAETDVFVENFREGVMDSLGLGYRDLSALQPDLLYVSLRGFHGAHASKAGHDLNFIAASGVGEFHLESGPNYATQWADMIGGTFLPAIQVLAHLANPERRGMHLVLHMDKGFRAAFLPRAFDALVASQLPEEKRAGFGMHHHFGAQVPHSRYYRCSDGLWLSVSCVKSQHWQALCELWGKPEWASRGEDPTLVPDVEALVATHPAAHWESLPGATSLCVFKVVPWAEHAVSLPSRESLLQDPLAWAGFPANPKLLPAPELGRDTFAALQAMGISARQCEDLAREGIVFQPNAGL
ncbi:CoA transferase [bacterium]|nr:CoA transferase [bacterium]